MRLGRRPPGIRGGSAPPARRRRASLRRHRLVAVLLLSAAALAYGLDWRSERPASGGREILEAFAERRSGVWVEASGAVERTLSDDREGSRHQRFILRLASGHTLLVAHNIDLAPRVPLRAGDAVDFRGEYEWNERGGVIHWTHHDPAGERAGGWIRHRGQVYE